MIKYIIFINGLYDILCAFSILYLYKFKYINLFATLHTNVFLDNYKNNLNNRLLAYWILLYGFIRLFIFIDNYYIKFLIFLTYIIEIYAFFNENFIFNTTNNSKVLFIILSSIIILYFLLL